MSMSDADWLLRGIALAETALEPEPLMSPTGNFFRLISDLDGESPMTLLVAVLAVISRFGRDLDPAHLQPVLDRMRVEALRVIAEGEPSSMTDPAMTAGRS